MSNRGRFGPEDEAGTLNLVDAGVVRAATGLVERGEVVSLAQALGPATPAPPHRRSPSRFLDRDGGDYAAGARSPDGFRFAEDTVQLAVHTGTHVDALAHVWDGDELYNGHPADGTRSTSGARRCGANALRPILTRAVLLDLREACDGPSTAIGPDALAAACAQAGTEPGRGDAVLLRTGWWDRTREDPTAYFATEPGIDEAGARWLAERDVAVVGADNYAVEVQPSPDGRQFPVHRVLLRDHGTPLIENLDFAALPDDAPATFLFVLAPLLLQGSLGAPATPLAVL